MANARSSTFQVPRSPLSPAVRRPGPAGAPSPCSACAVRHLTICAALGEEELRYLSSIVSHVELGPGQSLFQEGEEARTVYSVTAGTMKILEIR